MLRRICMLCLVLTLLGCAPGATVEQPVEAALPTSAPEVAPDAEVPNAEASIAPLATALPAGTETTGVAEEPESVAEDVPLFDGISHGYTADGFPFLGDANAPVTLIDYSDFL